MERADVGESVVAGRLASCPQVYLLYPCTCVCVCVCVCVAYVMLKDGVTGQDVYLSECLD